MFHIKYLQLLRHTPKSCYGTKSIFGNAYYSDKKKAIIVVDPLKDDLKKVKECIPVPPVPEPFKSKTADEIESIAFQNEQDILRTVMTEKEKDASVRSRLSKECNELFRNRKVTLCTTGLLHFDPIELQTSKKDDHSCETKLRTCKNPALVKNTTCTGKQGPSGGTSGSPGNRIKRGSPGKVLFAFIPVEWTKFLMPITGVSGFWTLLFTFGTFLVSKEYYVLEHNYYGGLSMMIVVWAAIKYVGPGVAAFADRQVSDYEKSFQTGRNNVKKDLGEQIDNENLMQMQADCQLIIVQAKRENVALQLEAEFRNRQMQVYNAVKSRLEYHLNVGEVYKRIQHKNLIEYVTKEVKKSVTPDMQHKLLNVSIESIIAEIEKGNKKK